MTKILTAAQMRSIEQAAIESGDVTGLELMERAGHGVVEAIFEEWPELAGDVADAGAKGGFAPRPAASPQDICEKKKRAVVLCGPGNNGGDGFVVARLLREHGWAVDVFLYGGAERMPPDARVNYERWCVLGDVARYEDDGGFGLEAEGFEDCLIFVDALFGTGLVRPVEGVDAFARVTQAAEWRLAPAQRKGPFPRARSVSIDLPSGICADSGRYLVSDEPHRPADKVRADLTVSFHRAKLGHFLQDGPAACGKLVVTDIGLEGWGSLGAPLGSSEEVVRLTSPRIWRGKATAAHKFSHGHALILSGGAGKTGAARLAARGALRIGAGLVTLAMPGAAQLEVASQVTAIMLTRAGTGDEFSEVLEDSRLNALCLGPGMGLARARELVPIALRAKRATVLDADALTAFADRPEELFQMTRGTQVVLTPHGGEFARLFPDIAEKLHAVPTKGPAYSKGDATREAAARAGCVVLFKGSDTVIAGPEGRCAINAAVYDRSAPWLATAGSGDVLAGFITGLLARGFDPLMAAETGAWLHVECARAFGPGLIAEDLPEMLPQVFRSLEKPKG
ncbi:MAG: NAD(P)H-hydrate dehydratase [Thalassovita sp.]